ncbi:hypothetical protein WIS52_12585 [Pseudonocardia nematodicida]|uniref:GLTT repeat-containing protein n=1 Tax=Pseudonocardia nematodicida TaxID=1206997 RepID=A0ABV1KBS3_9PSEU
MNSLARNALRFSLAGAGIAVLGTGVAGQASAVELPDIPGAPDTSALTDAVPDLSDETTVDADATVTFGGLETPELPSSDGLPDLLDTDALPGLPGVDGLELPSTDGLPELPSTDALPLDGVSTDALELPSADALPTDGLPALPSTDGLPSTDALPSLDSLPSADALDTDALDTDALDTDALPTLEIPDVMFVELPELSL